MSDDPTFVSTPVQGDAYAGDVSAAVAWDVLAQDKGAVLIDVRSQGEWSQLGVPDLASVGKTTVLIELETQAGPNPNFATQVEDAVADRDGVAIFVCRSGARSASAAATMTARGYSKCYNLVGGADVGGWNAAGLPWASQ
jgi:rhodanese-related sulfurtransferase